MARRGLVLADHFGLANIPDSTQGLTMPGVHSVRWLSPADWVKNQPVGGLTTSYWMRARITSGSVGVPPSQQTRHVCTANQGYVEIDETQIAGDLNALAAFRFISEGATEDTSTEVGIRADSAHWAKLCLAYATTSGGPILMPTSTWRRRITSSGVAVNVAPYRIPIPVITTTAESPAGSTLTWSNSNGDTEMSDLFTVVLDSTIAQEFYGEYRLLLRMKHDGQQGETTVRYTINFNTYLSATKTGKIKLIDAGRRHASR